VRSLFDLRGIASGVCEFKSCNCISLCAIAKLSLLVCILMFTTFPEPLLSVMALTQLTVLETVIEFVQYTYIYIYIKQLYSLYSIYNSYTVCTVYITVIQTVQYI